MCYRLNNHLKAGKLFKIQWWIDSKWIMIWSWNFQGSFLLQKGSFQPNFSKIWVGHHGRSRWPEMKWPIWGLIYTSFSVLGHWGKSRKLWPNTQNHGHVIQSVKLHFLHQMKLYLNVRAIWESIYTCFCVSVELVQVS